MKTEDNFKKLHKAVIQASLDLHEHGGGKEIRNNLGVEELFRWRIMNHLEKILEDLYFQSPEVKIGHPKVEKGYHPINEKYEHQPRFDIGILSRGKKEPILIAELKFTNENQLFKGKKEVTKDFLRLVDIMNYRKYKEKPVTRHFGLVYYLERSQKLKPTNFLEKQKEIFLAQTASPNVWNKQSSILENSYFEIIVAENPPSTPIVKVNLYKPA